MPKEDSLRVVEHGYWYCVDIKNPSNPSLLMKTRMGKLMAANPKHAQQRVETSLLLDYPGWVMNSIRIHFINPATGLKSNSPVLVITGGMMKDEAKKPVALLEFGGKSEESKDTKKDDGQSSHACEESKVHKTVKPIDWSTPLADPRPIVSLKLKETTHAIN